MRKIVIEKLKEEKEKVEIVERKGIGHPDYICDSACELASKELSQHYLKKFGSVLHHNLDKGLLIAGKAQPKFGGGKLLEKIKLIIAGRATDKVGKEKIEIKKIVTRAVKGWLSGFTNPDFFDIEVKYKAGSLNLQQVLKTKIPIANDTSFGVAHAPLTKTERLVLQSTEFLNSLKIPALGKDVKIMGLREKNKARIIVSAALIDKYINDVEEYLETKEKIKEKLAKFVGRFGFDTKMILNALDAEKPKKESDIYLTVTGLSAEQGDDGQVGRSNRPCGLITPCKGMSLEATAGKNINHPGKLYQVLAQILANRIAKEFGIECSVKILSQIGSRLDQPQIVSIKLSDLKYRKETIRIVNELLDNLRRVQAGIIKGRYRLF